ncbi:lipopolysaccharide kinase InaA family protein [Tautonia plasticadhaerens]|uniref:Lipopolysaccharide core heptose(I) kinase RfaP n=1 Tax=Tautonia plasticadhaerens TaxID=2527974 RepID=A0A518H565_9BACT|nr:lipopolysaccharide kinase InaA family protein [Tautonia plasticadhaerens]QDV35972.1 Lipopolysaccharide core heptose(I) kinase RfaP [Tautonia plasticadhaerens]
MISRIGTFLRRLTRGERWTWRSEAHRDRLPGDLEGTVMQLRSDDRLHAKQGRSTCRVRFDGPDGPLTVYLKRHYRLPWGTRVAALLHPDGRHSPAGAEWRHLHRGRQLGLLVPEPVAAGESIGPWGRFQSYLMVEELTGFLPLHEAIPEMARRLPPGEFDRRKRRLVSAMAGLTARLHGASTFHKDLYLCHYYVDLGRDDSPLYLIDLHRLATHRASAPWWRWKDLAQLLFSTVEVEGVDDRDRLRFWARYRRLMGLSGPGLELRMIRARAARYLSHNRKKARAG